MSEPVRQLSAFAHVCELITHKLHIPVSIVCLLTSEQCCRINDETRFTERKVEQIPASLFSC